jgi:hypothetical protein
MSFFEVIFFGALIYFAIKGIVAIVKFINKRSSKMSWDEGTEGQDRESYSDDQDRESYSISGEGQSEETEEDETMEEEDVYEYSLKCDNCDEEDSYEIKCGTTVKEFATKSKCSTCGCKLILSEGEIYPLPEKTEEEESDEDA